MPTAPPILRPLGWHPNAGGQDPFYKTKEWRELRIACFTRDGWRCVRRNCPTPDRGFGARLIANHKIPRRAGGADVLGNLETLCPTCDAAFHREKGTG